MESIIHGLEIDLSYVKKFVNNGITDIEDLRLLPSDDLAEIVSDQTVRSKIIDWQRGKIVVVPKPVSEKIDKTDGDDKNNGVSTNEKVNQFN